MTSRWISNSDATGQVKNLLERAGIPLELQVSDICDRFCKPARKNGVVKSSDRLVYCPHNLENDYRELDRLVVIYEELEIGKTSGIQLSTNIPIECKYRKDMELFAFKQKDKSVYKRFPFYAGNYGSDLFQQMMGTLEVFPKNIYSNIVLLEIKDGTTPQKVHEENLIYNAAGAVYDFILFDITGYEVDNTHKSEFELIEKLGVFEKAIKNIESTRYPLDYRISKFISGLSIEDCRKYNRMYYGETRFYDVTISVHMPIVCINGPIYDVTWNPKTGVNSFSEISHTLTSFRKRGWPGVIAPGLLTRDPEVPIFVTNPQNLRSVLNFGRKWYQAIREKLTSAPGELVERFPLQSAVYKRVTQHYDTVGLQPGYRSDIYAET